MINKWLYAALCFSLCTTANAQQDCALLQKGIENTLPKPYQSVRVCKQYVPYDMKYTGDTVIARLSKYFQDKEVNDLMQLISAASQGHSELKGKTMCSGKMELYSYEKTLDMQKRNIRIKNSERFRKMSKHEKAIIYFAKPIYHGEYAILQIDCYILPMNITTNILLLKRNKEDWEIVSHLASMAS